MFSPKRALFVLPALVLCSCLLFQTAVLAYDGERTYDTLTQEENSELERLSALCMDEVRQESLALLEVRLDVNTILRTFTEQIRVVRQKKRHLFLDVERYLYSLRLNTEFISNYMHDLREDTIYHSLDALIRKSRGRR